MKNTYLHIIFSLLVTLLTTACSDELDIPQESVLNGGEVMASIDFGFKNFENVRVTTRTTLDEGAESRVHNIFLLLFSNGEKVFSKYYDDKNRKDNIDLAQYNMDCWYVNNKTDALSNTTGKICMRAPALTNAHMYLFANIDADMLNISPNLLYTIQKEEQLKELTASMNQPTVSRNGYFPMVENLENVSIARNTGNTKLADVKVDGVKATAKLKRLDAKVQFYVKVAVDNKTEKPNGEVTTTQKLKAFIPESWRAVNIPKGAYVVERPEDKDDVGYFNTAVRKFETSEMVTVDGKSTEKHGFSFYMLENRELPKKSVGGNYHLRDKRNKNAYGKYDNSQGMWEYASEGATYLEIKGRVIMEVDVSNEAPTQKLEADVKYYIHLGDLTSSMDNFSVERNTFYTYTITIKGVNSIEVEVQTSRDGDPSKVNEAESGATGMVYVAKESIFTFDAHYGQRVFAFDADFIVPETVTWYVKTPFGKEGVPNKVGDTEIPSGMDYKWVHFYVNEIDESNKDPLYATLDKPYSHKNRPYPGDQYQTDQQQTGKPWLMNVVQFTKFIKDEKRKLDAKPMQPNAFRKEFDQEWYDWYVLKYPIESNDKNDTSKPYWRNRIYMTVYVDEFYYDTDPITGAKRQDLWKEFVNQPNRLMHILCDSDKSLDEESTATGSVITLRQQSIQTPYNLTKNGLMTAWGCESLDETADSYLWFFDTSENVTGGTRSDPSLAGTSKYNGAYNTAKLWGLNPNNGGFGNTVYWYDNGVNKGYLDFNVENDHRVNKYNIIFLKEKNAVMRYAAMMRNRDNNGNGRIDPDELRWYIASIDQLYGLYMGQYGVSDDAAIYTRKRASLTGIYEEGPYYGTPKWRYHIVSSTGKGNYPIQLWAEEGISVSEYKAYAVQKPAAYAIRCVRNLGMDPKNQFDTEHEEENVSIPEKLVKVHKVSGSGTNAVYRFDLSNINEKSLRFYTSHELEPMDEFSEMSMPYKGFETGPAYSISYAYQDPNGVRNLLLQGRTPCTDTHYRVPNVREGALMSLYISDDSWWKVFSNADKDRTYVSSYYSNGEYGYNKDKGYYSWQFANGFASIGASAGYIRSVKDWNPVP